MNFGNNTNTANSIGVIIDTIEAGIAAAPKGAGLGKASPTPRYITLTNARLVLANGTLSALTSLHIDMHTGLLCAPPLDATRNDDGTVVDLGGKWLSPGMIDIQINGAFGVDLSEFENPEEYARDVQKMGEGLCRLGITSFVPTIISQKKGAYRSIIPLLSNLGGEIKGQPRADSQSPTGSGPMHTPGIAATPLGWHVEGPFLSPKKVGCHPPENLAVASAGIAAFEDMYGNESMEREEIVKIITLAPEVEGVNDAIPQLVQRGWTVSLGHTNASTPQAQQGVEGGAILLTHLFNAMPALHHREPSIVGLLGLSPHTSGPTSMPSMAQRVQSSGPSPVSRSIAPSPTPSPVLEQEHEIERERIDQGANGDDTASEFSADMAAIEGSQVGDHPVDRPFFSIIADGIHVHPQAVCMAYNAHPSGCILVSDAMHMLDPDLKDGLHPWRDGMIEKKDGGITLAGTETLAGSILPLPEAVRNLSTFSGITLPQAIVCATYNPAKCLGGHVGEKVGFEEGCWADLVLWTPEGQVQRVLKGGREVPI